MPERTFFRRFKVLLAVLAICIAATAYWGVFQYHEIKLKDRVRKAVYELLQQHGLHRISTGKFEQIAEEKNQIKFTLELNSKVGKQPPAELIQDPLFHEFSNDNVIWARSNDDLKAQIIQGEKGKVKMIGEMKN